MPVASVPDTTESTTDTPEVPASTTVPKSISAPKQEPRSADQTPGVRRSKRTPKPRRMYVADTNAGKTYEYVNFQAETVEEENNVLHPDAHLFLQFNKIIPPPDDELHN